MKAKKYEGIRIAKAEMEDHLKDEMINRFLMESDENQEINRRITLGMLFTVDMLKKYIMFLDFLQQGTKL